MITKPKVLLLIGVLWLVMSGLCMADSVPPAPTKDIYVYDSANVLDSETKTSLLTKLSEFDKNGGGQIVLVTTNDYGEYSSIEEYSNDLFNKWGIGYEGKDNGVLVVINPKAHKARIEVGRGYEGDLPDIASRHIIDEQGIPYFKKNDYNGGSLAMVDAITNRLGSGEEASKDNEVSSGSDLDGGDYVLIIITILVVLILLNNFVSKGGRGGGSGGIGSGGGGIGFFGGGSGSSSSSSSFGGGGSDGGGASGGW